MSLAHCFKTETVCFEPKYISTSTISNIPIPGAPSVEAILLLDVELPPDREKELCDQVWSGQVGVIEEMFMIMFMISCNSAIIGSCFFAIMIYNTTAHRPNTDLILVNKAGRPVRIEAKEF